MTLPHWRLCFRRGVYVLALAFAGRGLDDWTLLLACLPVGRRGKLAEHVKKLFDREANPKGQFEQRLLVMIIDEFTSVRTDGDRQRHVSNGTTAAS